MEREFGAEIVRSFGTHLKRTYQLDESDLPREIVVCLEKLQDAEHRISPMGASRPSEDQDQARR